MLLLHSWWGLTGGVRQLADRLADEGYTVLAPDMNDGKLFIDPLDAEAGLAASDANRLARMTLSSVELLAERAVRPGIGIVGMSMGASLGLWASIRVPENVAAVAAFYGTQTIDFAGARAAYQLHYADRDEFMDADEVALMEATIALEGLALEVHRYPGTQHWFFELGRPEYDSAAAELAWDRLSVFLSAGLGG